MVATNAIAKIAAVAAGLALVASAFAFAPAAKAATTFTMDLTLGSTGAEVTALQTWLISGGYSIPAGATGYFGAQTQAALAAYQAANGIAPAAGYFGPITRAKVNAAGGTTGGSTGGNTGGSSSDEEGYLDEFDQIGSYSSEEVGEDEEDVAVLGVEMEAADADQTIERVTVEIDTPAGSSPSDDLEDYIADVSVWLDGEELGRMEVDEASHDRQDDEYTFRFTGLDGMIADGDVGELVVAVTGISNLDSSEEGDGWTVTIPANGIRAVSPNGVDDTYDSNSYNEDFTLETFASANDVELKASLGDENPEEGVAVVDDEGDEVVLLEGELKAEGSDMDIFEIPFTFATTSANLSAIFDELTLEIDGDEKSENTTTTYSTSNGRTVFDDLDLAIDEDDTVSFRLIGTAADDTYDGESVSATLDVDGIDAEDRSGESLGSADLTGSANGEIQHLFTVAPEIDMDSITVDIDPADNGNAAAEAATAIIEFDLYARGGDIFLNGDDETTAPKEAFVVAALGNASTTISSYTVTITGASDVDNAAADDENYQVSEDKKVHVKIEAVVLQQTVTTTTILAGLEVTAVKYGTDRTSDTTRSAKVLNWSDLLDELETPRTALTNPS